MATDQPSLVLLRRREVEKKTGLCRASIYAKMARGEFPQPVPITQGSVRWLESEVDAWIEGRLAAREKGGPRAPSGISQRRGAAT